MKTPRERALPGRPTSNKADSLDRSDFIAGGGSVSLTPSGVLQIQRNTYVKPNIYIAGKIGKNDFRHALIPGLREHHPDSGPLDCGAFRYVGPFFESCDHGCRHGRNSHGVLGEFEPSCEL